MQRSSEAASRDRILNAAHKMTRLPLLPEFAKRILEVSRLPPDEVDISELAELVSRDSALVARILRAANSPYYALKVPVVTPRQAIVIIGLNDFLSLLLSASISNVFKSKTELVNLDLAQFWVHSLAVGAAAQAMSHASPISMVSPTEINLAALIHDIGKSLLYAHFPEQYDRCLDRARSSQLFLEQTETEDMGIDHAELGGIMAEQWQLPEMLIQTVRNHHAPSAANEVWRDSAWMIARADNLILTEGIGQSGNTARTLERMDQIKPNDGASRPAAALPEEQKAAILNDVVQTLKATLVLWETSSVPDRGNPTPQASHPFESPASNFRSQPQPHPAAQRQPNTLGYWMQRLLRFFRIQN